MLTMFYIYIYISSIRGWIIYKKKKSVKFENVERDEREIFVCYIIFNIRNIEN